MVGDESAREAERLRALARFDILDTAAEDPYEDIAKLAALVCGTRSALITLIDRDRQWFKARVNFDAQETERAIALCDHTIRHDDILVVDDTLKDPRFANNPLVTGGPLIRFYAGAPLITVDGHAIGSLAAIDYVPHTLAAEQRDALRRLARQVMAQLELRWHLRQTRQHATERFEMFTRATNDVIYDLDLRTGSLWFSEGLPRIYGESDRDTTFEAWFKRVHPEDAARIDTAMQELLAGPETSFSAEYRFRRVDDSYAHVLDRGYVMRDETGQPVRMVGAMIDLSERVKLEDQVIRAQRMQAIGQLAGGVAHDFNNILTVIECNAFLLQRDADEEERTQHIEEIILAVDRAASLTRQLLLVSRKQQAMRRVPVKLQDVVDRMSQMLRRLIGDQIDLQIVNDPSLQPVDADVSMIEQVVLNLAINARDAMNRGGKLSLETRAIRLDGPITVFGSQLAPGPYAMLLVHDTGSGIPADLMPKIFDAFFTTKETGKGTGLGLSTVHAIIRQHGGAVDVESTVGLGSTFVVYLPASRSPATTLVTTHPSRQLPRGTETLLVVEDEPIVRTGVCSLLREFGYTVLEAASARDALEIWQAERDRIALVVTDLMMPGGMSGHDLAARLRGERPGLPIIYSSGYSDEFAGQGEPLVEGVNFLAKPYPPASLAQLVRDRLDRRQTRA